MASDATGKPTRAGISITACIDLTRSGHGVCQDVGVLIPGPFTVNLGLGGSLTRESVTAGSVIQFQGNAGLLTWASS